ncbi:MAG: hypothetical protein LYZ69_01875 [Nitrososphaerales archaeon]|nr:hypothetical protein [Nitrososphaerales archaeon]
MASRASRAFIDFGVIGTILAFYHAWLEHAFSTNPFQVSYSPYASFFGVPYWFFGVVWFPVVLAVGLWSTRLGKIDLEKKLLVLLTVGNLFTAYLWYLDILVIRAFTPVYVGLYATNYVLTGLAVLQNRRNDKIQGFVYGTVVGAAVGLIFGPFGVAACGIVGGIFGAVRNIVLPQKASSGESSQNLRP